MWCQNTDDNMLSKESSFANSRVEVANNVWLDRELMNKRHLDKYRAKRKLHHIHSAAAKIWSYGVPWDAAVQMVTEAVDATTFEAQSEQT